MRLVVDFGVSTGAEARPSVGVGLCTAAALITGLKLNSGAWYGFAISVLYDAGLWTV